MNGSSIAAGINFTVWTVAAAFLSQGLWRRLFGKPRSLDDIWTIAFLIVVIRQVGVVAPYVGQWLIDWSMWTAAAVGVAYIAVIRGYMRDDRS